MSGPVRTFLRRLARQQSWGPLSPVFSRWASSVSDERLAADGIGPASLVAGSGSGHAAVVLHPNQQPSSTVIAAVGETDDRFDEFAVRERRRFFSL